MKRIVDSIKVIFGWPLSILAFFFIFRFSYPALTTFFSHIEEINLPLLFLGAFFFLLYFFLRGYLWQRILMKKGYRLPLRESMFLWELAEVKRYVPGNIWSILGRTVLFSNKKVPVSVIFSSLVLEIQLLLLGSLLVSLFGIPIILERFTIPSTIALGITAFIICVSVGFLVLVRYFKKQKLMLDFVDKLFVNPAEMVKLTIVSSLFMLFFGMGSYLTILSITSLSPVFFFQLVGLFSFSFLVGYLFLVVPMGLGVREAVAAAGLSSFMTLPLAGLAALFSRFVLVLSEIIFLIFAFLWKR